MMFQGGIQLEAKCFAQLLLNSKNRVTKTKLSGLSYCQIMGQEVFSLRLLSAMDNFLAFLKKNYVSGSNLNKLP